MAIMKAFAWNSAQLVYLSTAPFSEHYKHEHPVRVDKGSHQFVHVIGLHTVLRRSNNYHDFYQKLRASPGFEFLLDLRDDSCEVVI